MLRIQLLVCIAMGMTAGVQHDDSDAISADYDVVIRGAMLYDGSGESAYIGDLAIMGDRIEAVGDIGDAIGRREINAEGLAVAPGFINMMSWSPTTIIMDGRVVSDIKQGVTLEVFGEGMSWGPLNKTRKVSFAEELAKDGVELAWTTLGEYLRHLEDRGVSTNVASFVGHETIRIHELGYEDRQATTDELERMQELVREAMREGALGVASSLIYTPGAYADTSELIGLAKAAGEFGGIYASHMRNEGDQIFEALDELITIAREADVPAEIYHIKLASSAMWDRFDELIATIEAARAEGLQITADMYTYPAGSTGLDALMPPWSTEGGDEAWIARLKDPATRERIRKEMLAPSTEWENMYVSTKPEGVLLVDFRNKALRKYIGKTLAEVAEERGTHPADTAMDLVIEEGARGMAVYFAQSEDVVRKMTAVPWVSFCSDAPAMAAEGTFIETSVHPRAYGSFARLIAKYVRDEGMLSLEEAVRKLSALPANNLSLAKRGRLEPGYFADIAIFDPDTFQDNADYDDPHHYATGMKYVLVNGELVLEDGEPTDARPGRFVKGPGAQDG
ncbi:MAG: D-aminoacylase [Gammaproteobacteria bacterium]|nr:D-aminoacylase [Gammaproteobacteria bacterium]